MLKRLIELLVGAAFIYAGWHAGVAYLHYFQFQDALAETARFAGGRSEPELRQRIRELAVKYDIPLDADAVTVQTDGDSTRIVAPYVQPVKLLPNYVYQWEVEARGEAWHMGGPTRR